MLRIEIPELAFTLDARRMGLSPADLDPARWAAALAAMAALEQGALANPDEGRAVGHFWLRAPELAPADSGEAIRRSWAALDALLPALRGRFAEVVILGIGGSALGPMLLADALGTAPGGCPVRVLDNTDPDGFDRLLGAVDLPRTLFVVISKSGSTVETRNGQLEAQHACARAGLDFAQQALAITVPGSALDRQAEGWLGRLPMWDWVGGRFSVTSLVGLLPLALMGRDWRAFLEGAAVMDHHTRAPQGNPAVLLAAGWLAATEGQARRAMVVLPYKDRLLWMSRYLQQLVMESLGKARDRAGRVVHQGLTVYGNKGSTDQHAFVQQLREGPDDVFVTFLFALLDREGPSPEVLPGATAGDTLLGFLLGTRAALTEAGRRSATLVLDRIDERSLGALIALYERAVGLYAERLNLNAYHQPGVEAGKKAAAQALALQAQLLQDPHSAEGDDAELILAHLRRNGR